MERNFFDNLEREWFAKLAGRPSFASRAPQRPTRRERQRAAAEAHSFLADLGIVGVPKPEDAWRLAALFAPQLEVDETLPRGFAFILYRPPVQAVMIIPAEGTEPLETRAGRLLHELGHFLLTYGTNTRRRWAEVADAPPSRQRTRAWLRWQSTERQANAFRDAWLRGTGDD